MSSPIKLSFKTELLPISIIVGSIISAFYLYHNFPARVATHWDIYGQVNGYSGPFLAAWLLPFMIIGIYALFIFLPYIDPRKQQYLSFEAVYHKFKNIIISFLFILYILSSLNGLGYSINIGFWSPVMIGFLFMIIGYLLKDVKMNWFMGIRTQWTMSSNYVWEKTHQASAPILIFSGGIMALSAFLSSTSKIIAFVLAMVLIIIALPAYSYILFKREEKEKNKLK
jgi:uncharacterized membrane protein